MTRRMLSGDLDDGAPNDGPDVIGTAFKLGKDPLLDQAYGYGAPIKYDEPRWWGWIEKLVKRRDLLSLGWYHRFPITARLEFKAQDAWMGLFWKVGRCGCGCVPYPFFDWRLPVVEVWLCIVPFLPLHLRIHFGCWLREPT